MSCEQFRDWNPRKESIMLVAHCKIILEELSEYRLTLRQLYYQLVSRAVIENSQKSYSRLGSLVGNARLAGLLDWSSIEDRVRQPDIPAEFQDLRELTDAALHTYRLPRWQDQNDYVELWVEKDALASVLSPIAREYHVTLMVNRGYSSLSAMKESAERFLVQDEKTKTLLYLGDFDPSGEDMVRDVRERLYMFGVHDLNVIKLALTMEQVEEHKPPPNPVKMTDSRAKEFIEKYDIYESWELDALPPAVLHELIKTEISQVCDMPMMQAVIAQEEKDKELLIAAIEHIDE